MGALSDASRQTAPADNELRVGTVVRLTNPTTNALDGVYVSFSPDPSATPARCSAITGYAPVVGDVVQVLRQGSQFLILGESSAPGLTWVSMTAANSWVWAGGGAPGYEFAVDTSAKRVYVTGEITGGTNAAGTIIGYVYAGFTMTKRQTHAVGVNVMQAVGSWSPFVQMVPGTNQGPTGGTLQVYGAAAASIVYLDCSFPYNAP